MGERLTSAQRDAIAADAAIRYAAGETWKQIAERHDLSGEYVRRLTTRRHHIVYRRWGQQPVADSKEVCRLRDEGKTLDAIAAALGCSRQAVRTALEAADRVADTRYPALGRRRRPTPAELEQIAQLYENCPPAPRARPGARYVRGGEGRALAEACRHLIDEGVPMQTLSQDLGRGATWIHWLLDCHDLRPSPRTVRSTARKTRTLPGEPGP